MHLLLPILVLCSAIFRRVFLALRSPRSLREPLLQLRCHHLALATQLALAQKSTFLKIPISFTPLIPCLLPPREEREKTERTTAQLPTTKKCFLLILTTSSLLCPLPPQSHWGISLALFVHYSPHHMRVSLVPLCSLAPNLIGVLGLNILPFS